MAKEEAKSNSEAVPICGFEELPFAEAFGGLKFQCDACFDLFELCSDFRSYRNDYIRQRNG